LLAIMSSMLAKLFWCLEKKRLISELLTIFILSLNLKKRTLDWGIRSESITSPLRLRKPYLDTSNPPSHAHPIPTSHAQPHFVTFIS
jgi:hypothetical protein